MGSTSSKSYAKDTGVVSVVKTIDKLSPQSTAAINKSKELDETVKTSSIASPTANNNTSSITEKDIKSTLSSSLDEAVTEQSNSFAGSVIVVPDDDFTQSEEENIVMQAVLNQMEAPDPSMEESELPEISSYKRGSVGNNASMNSLRIGTAGRKALSRILQISSEVNIDECIEKLRNESHLGKNQLCLRNNDVIAICHQARELFMSQSMFLRIKAPVKIVGDTHGQFNDLLRIFEMGGYPPDTRYLFLGDYVDRGRQSLETILLLLCYKIKYPDGFFILRGNHECASVNRVYGFFDECKRRCSIKIWRTFTDVFNCLPVAAVISDKIFCVHGGLSPTLHQLDDIEHLKRPSDVPEYGLLNDLLWSDPSDAAEEWEENDRGVSFVFGKPVLNQFLRKHNLDLVCRAHMVVEDGYEFFGNRQLVTVFSAPNYCGEFNNRGAIMNVTESLVCSFEILQPNYQ